MSNNSLVTSVTHSNVNVMAGKQKPYWVEIQLVDEKNVPVANMPWKAESHHPTSGPVKNLAYTGQSDAQGLIRIDMPHGLELTLKLEATPLVKEMEKRILRARRDAETDSEVRSPALDAGYIWHYVVSGEICAGYPDIELRKGESFPPFHFPPGKSFKGLTIRTNELKKRHVVEICPFRAWELVLHHQIEYSMANAINLGASASLAYADGNALDIVSITRFYINQCQDLSRLPQLYKSGFRYNTLVRDVPFSDRYYPPIFMDTSKDTSEMTDNEEKSGIAEISKSESVTKADGDTQLFYVYNTDQVIVAWRGTASLYNVGTDLAFSPVNTEICGIKKTQCKTLLPTGKVHDGFFSGYSRVERLFKKEMENLKYILDGVKLFIAGHSLGGALALIHAVELRNYKPLLYTYGMPRAFTRDAVAQLSDITHYRHVNDNDPVSAVPPEANLDNELYKLWRPLGKTLGMLWSTGQAIASPAISWGDCFWHHGNPIVFLTATQSRQWKECKTDLPVPAGCITLKGLMPVKVKLYLVPALANQDMQLAGHKQRELKESLVQSNIKNLFPEGSNHSRGFDITFNDHFMTSYMPYINNKLLELIDKKGLIEKRSFTEHLYNIDLFKEQMNENRDETPSKELERNKIFLNIEGLLSTSLSSVLSDPEGNTTLVRFASYTEEVIENV